MRQVQKDLNPLTDEVVTFLTADACHKSDTASIVFVRRIIQTLGSRHPSRRVETGRHGLRLMQSLPFELVVLGRASPG